MPDAIQDRVPDGIEPLVGFRAWYVSLHGDEAHFHPLGGPMGGWEGAGSGWVAATCLLAPWTPHAHLSLVTDEPAAPNPPCDLCGWGHIAPDERCTCGFYAFKDLAPELVALLEHEPDPGLGPDTRIVIGRVELAGKVIEHDLGYRAGGARIAALIPVEGEDTFTREVSSVTGIPLDPGIELPRTPDGFPVLSRLDAMSAGRWSASWREHDDGFPFGWVWVTCGLFSWTLASAGGPRVPGIVLFGTVVLGWLFMPWFGDKIRALFRRGRAARLKVVR